MKFQPKNELSTPKEIKEENDAITQKKEEKETALDVWFQTVYFVSKKNRVGFLVGLICNPKYVLYPYNVQMFRSLLVENKERS